MKTALPPRLGLITLAALAAIWSGPSAAAVSTTGSFSVGPVSMPVGPGDTDLGSNSLSIGVGAPGSFAVNAGSQFSAASLVFGAQAASSGSGVFDGAGTRVALTADGNFNRLDLGLWGVGEVTVSGGASFDGRANSAACLLGAKRCNSYIGNGAGSTGTLTVTGAGSSASFLRSFVIGNAAVFSQAQAGFNLGTSGGTTHASVNVTAGGLLTTDSSLIGAGPGGGSPLGTERSVADVRIDGAGSMWRVTGGTLEAANAFITLGNHSNATTTLGITNGGVLHFEGAAGRDSGINIAVNGATSDMWITGAGSRVEMVGDGAVLQIGRSLGKGTLWIGEGGVATGMYYAAVGRDGATGELTVDGSGSLFQVNRRISAVATGSTSGGALDIGRGGGMGTVTVSNGGMVHLFADQGTNTGMTLNLGRDAGSTGTLNIAGAGSVLKMESLSSVPGGGTGETLNPTVRIGRDGSGTLNITAGAKLLLEGGAVSTPAVRRSTNIYIGGSSDTTVGGTGTALVSGAGSEIRVTGGDTFVGVAIGPQSKGSLTVENGASISAMGINVGRSGGEGTLTVNNATLNFSGLQTAGNQVGGFFSVGGGSGSVGKATLDHGSVVTLSNTLGGGGANVVLGGNNFFPGGVGSLTLAGGSKILMETVPGQGGVTVGFDGSGVLRMSGASEIDTGAGSLFVARLPGSDGRLILSEGSTVKTGWVGVGRNLNAGVESEGGEGTMLLFNSSLQASTIVIGAQGILCGTGGITGNVTNHGLFCPGNSPGKLTLNGDYTGAAGSKLILEVQRTATGFDTDALVFGGAVDLAATQIEFRFLGDTNPSEFLASGHFDIDTFLGHDNGAGGLTPLGDASFAGVQFSASAEGYAFTSFSYDPGTGAVFTAQAVPEPATWLTLGLGLFALAVRRSGRRQG